MIKKVKKLKKKKEIPIKKVNISFLDRLFKYSNDNRLTGMIVKGKRETFYGTSFFFISGKIAPESFVTKVKGLEHTRTIEDIKTLVNLSGAFYKYNYFTCSDSDITDFNIVEQERRSILILKSKIGCTIINYEYYCYFKILGIELRMIDPKDNIGLFKDKKFVGVLMPIHGNGEELIKKKE